LQFASTGRAEASATMSNVKQTARKCTGPAAELAERRRFKKSIFGKVRIPKHPNIDLSHSLFSLPLPAKELAEWAKLIASGVTG